MRGGLPQSITPKKKFHATRNLFIYDQITDAVSFQIPNLRIERGAKVSKVSRKNRRHFPQLALYRLLIEQLKRRNGRLLIFSLRFGALFV